MNTPTASPRFGTTLAASWTSRSGCRYAPRQRDIKTNVAPMRLQHHVACFLAGTSQQRIGLRELLVQEISQSDCPAQLGAILLQECVASKKHGRLDDATDILSASGVSAIELTRFVQVMYQARKFTNLPDDVQYVLISVSARSVRPSDYQLVLAGLAQLSGAACEASISAIANSDRSDRVSLLKWAAESTSSRFIRDLANEYLCE